MSKDAKLIRGQIRQIAQELLPTMLNDELVKAIEKRLFEKIDGELAKINERQKDIQSYMIRNSVKK